MEADELLESIQTSQKDSLLQNKSEFSQSDELVYYIEQPSLIKGRQLKFTVHRSMVAITFLDANKKINFGSGVLISRNVVLTAAQNIFNKELNAENTDFKIYIGANGVAEEYHQAEGWRYPEEFKTCNTSAKLPHNYAIVKLKKPTHFQQYLSLSLACKECLLRENKKIELKVYGFPYVYPPDTLGNVPSFEKNFKPFDQNGTKMVLYQYGLTREGIIAVIEDKQSKIGYEISTLPGQRGCPVIMNEKIIAVHVGGDKEKFNVGRMVDVSFMESLWKWREELCAAPFKLRCNRECYHVKKMLQKMRYKLDLRYKQLKSVDLWGYGNLLDLDLQKNQLQQIDLTNCLHIIKLNLGDNQLQRIDLTSNKHLIQVHICSNQLQEIDVRTNTNLAILSLHHNQLQQIDVRSNLNITQLGLAGNRITEIDLIKNTKLESLWLNKNKLVRVRLCITENVEERRYTNCFSISNQQSVVCRVDVQCEGQTEAVRRKAIMLVNDWMQQCSGDRQNEHNCAYNFLAL